MRHSCVIVFFFIIYSTVASLTLRQKRAGTVKYDCGCIIFDEASILENILFNSFREKNDAEIFTGLLYKQSLSYRILPVLYHHQAQIFQSRDFFIVIDQLNNLVDVVAQMKNGHYIKCNRLDSSMLEPPQIDPNEEFGYECGHEFFTHDTLKLTVAEGAQRIGQNRIYPIPYKGNLYDLDLELWIYPILRGSKAHQVSRMPENTYFAVISRAGKLIDVVARLSNNYFMKCSRSSRKPDTTEDQDLQVGYLCGTEFFGINHLKDTAYLAKVKRESKKTMVYPKHYNGPPFEQDYWIYPLFTNGRFYIKGGLRVKYLLIMDKLFKVKSVAITTSDGMQPCQETLRGITSTLQETDNFLCELHLFENDHLRATVDIACKALGTSYRSYPAKYIGPDFSIIGPYLTWPLVEGGMYKYVAGRFRVVMTTECQFVGAIVKVGATFQKCMRENDFSIPGGDSTIPIREIHSIRSRQNNRKSKVLRTLDNA